MVHRRSVEAGLKAIRALQMLAEGKNLNEVARLVGVRQGTLRRWVWDEDFDAVLQEVRRHYPNRKQREAIETLTTEAIEALRQTLQGEDGTEVARTAREVLKLTRETASRKKEVRQEKDGLDDKREIKVRYMTPNGKPISISPWAERNPPK